MKINKVVQFQTYESLFFVQMLDILLTTLVRELQSKTPGREQEAESAARRFIRSVARIFVIVSVEIAPPSKKK